MNPHAESSPRIDRPIITTPTSADGDMSEDDKESSHQHEMHRPSENVGRMDEGGAERTPVAEDTEHDSRVNVNSLVCPASGRSDFFAE